MIREAIDRILEISRPNVIPIGGEEFTDKKLYRVDRDLRAESINMTTLSSLVEYIKNADEFKEGNYFVHIISPTKVSLISGLDFDRKREILVSVNAELPDFEFNHAIEQEQFIIGVQSKFVDHIDDDKALILKFAGTVKNGSISEYSDDGVSQKATIKKGVSAVADAIVPNPCRLTPFRTFTEVEQPTSQFIFRLKDGMHGDIYCALYEADGGKWKLEAKESIKKYLEKNLNEIPNILIIS